MFSAGEVQAFHEDLNGRQYINEVYKFSVDKLYDILFTESQFMSDFMEQRRFSGSNLSDCWSLTSVLSGDGTSREKCGYQFIHVPVLSLLLFRRGLPPVEEGGGWEPDERDHVHHLSVQPPGPQNSHSH